MNISYFITVIIFEIVMITVAKDNRKTDYPSSVWLFRKGETTHKCCFLNDGIVLRFRNGLCSGKIVNLTQDYRPCVSYYIM